MQFATSEEAKKAVERLNNLTIGFHKIQVQLSQARVVKGTASELERVRSHFGNVHLAESSQGGHLILRGSRKSR